MHEAYRTFSGTRDPVPGPGIELQAPALGEWCLSHWVTRKVPKMMGCFFFFIHTAEGHSQCAIPRVLTQNTVF